MKNYFHLFVYLSLGFLLFALYHANYLVIPNITNSGYVVLSLLLLCLGFVMDAYAWHQTLRVAGEIISLKDAMASMGLSIFGKYIPGKFWVIAGRAAFISKQYDLNEKNTTIISLNAQFISLWAALLIGGIGVFLIEGLSIWGVGALLLLVILSLVLFTKWCHSFIENTFLLLLKKTIQIPQLKPKDVFRVIHWYLTIWVLWSIAFYFLAMGLTAHPVHFMVGFVFTIGATLGLLVLFAPGGIGVREGVLYVFLVSCGLTAPEATTVAVSSRLWFLTGEFFIFILGYSLNKKLLK